MVTNLTRVKVKVPEELVKNLELLVEAGIYATVNDAIRDAIRHNLEEKHEAR